jgi:hypothetical protein
LELVDLSVLGGLCMRAAKSLKIVAVIAASLRRPAPRQPICGAAPPKVTVGHPCTKPVTRYLEATGNLSSVNSADLVARVPGFVQEINYQDGASGRPKDAAVHHRARAYQVKLEQAKAAEVGAEATLKQTQATLPAPDRAAAAQTTTQANYDQALAARDSAQATIDQAKSSTQLAQINDDYTQSSRRSTASSPRGRCRSANTSAARATPTVLATIVQHDPIYAKLQRQRARCARRAREAGERGLKVEKLDRSRSRSACNRRPTIRTGQLDYVRRPSTSHRHARGARSCRIQRHVLLPGYFVRVRIPRGAFESMLRARRSARQRPGRALRAGGEQGQRSRAAQGRDRTTGRRPCASIVSGLTATTGSLSAGLLRAVPARRSIRRAGSAAATRA